MLIESDPNLVNVTSESLSTIWTVLALGLLLIAGTIGAILPTTRSFVGHTCGLIWLVTLYLATPWLAVGALSSMQFRSDVQQEYKTEVDKVFPISLRVTRTITQKWHDYDQAKQGFAKLSTKFEQENETYQTLDTEATQKLVNMALQVKLSPERMLLLDAWEDICLPEKKENVDICREKNFALGGIAIRRQTRVLRLKQIENAKAELNHQFTQLSEEEISAWPTELTKAGLTSAVGDLQSRLQFMHDWRYDSLLVMPNQVLTLILAIAMGALGSTITMTWMFLSSDRSPTLRWYLIRPLVGAVSALVIFVFAKAGQMALTENGAAGQLDPFFLSFVGIVGGLLSDRAYAQMEAVGGRFLGRIEIMPDRWTTGLDGFLEPTTQLTQQKMAEDLSIDPTHLGKVVSRSEKATYAEQRRIADYLHQPLYKLFTDANEN